MANDGYNRLKIPVDVLLAYVTVTRSGQEPIVISMELYGTP